MYLLDTNALIILLHDELADAGLRMETRQIMLTEDKLYLSWVSLWEMAIKMKLGKLAIEGTITEIVDACLEQGIEIIPVKVEHIDETLALPLLLEHKDPFDRLILAVAKKEELTLISTDARMRASEYGVDVIW